VVIVIKKSYRKIFHHKKVINYYKRSKFGYNIVLWGSKHFGFYPSSNNDIHERRAQELMQDLIARKLHINKNQLILDAGCGRGIVSTYLSKKYGCKIVGIEIVPFEVESAKKLAKNLDLESKVEYHLMDYSNTTFRDNHFDAIYTMESFVHSLEAKKTLHEFLRILKPGGRLAMFEYTIADDKKFTHWEKNIMDIVIEGSGMASLKNLRHDSFPKTLKEVGFVSVEEQNITKHVGPSLERLHKLSIIPYFFVNLFGLHKNFINLTAGYELYKITKKGLIRYCIFAAKKPK